MLQLLRRHSRTRSRGAARRATRAGSAERTCPEERGPGTRCGVPPDSCICAPLIGSFTITGVSGSPLRAAIPLSISFTGTWTMRSRCCSSRSRRYHLCGRSLGQSAEGRARVVVDEQTAVAVEDRPARRLEPDGAQLVVPRHAQVLVAGEDLQRPEPQEQRGEDEQDDTAEDRDPQRGLRRQAVRLFDSRIGRKETVPLAKERGPPSARSRQSSGGSSFVTIQYTGAVRMRLNAIVGDERLEQDAPAGDGIAEQEVEHQHADRVEHRHDGDGEVRRVGAVAARRLAVAADPVAAHRQQRATSGRASGGWRCRARARRRSRPPRRTPIRAGARPRRSSRAGGSACRRRRRPTRAARPGRPRRRRGGPPP